MIKFTRTTALTLFALAMLAIFPAASQAATSVKVDLWDKMGDQDMPTNLKYGMPGVDNSKAPMGIKLSRDRVPHGKVTFNVVNSSKDTVHEMIVVKLDEPGKPLTYVDSEERVDEEKVNDRGEVSELDPGKSGSLTLDLDAGDYLLICNVPGHFAAGMWSKFTVTP
jgi:uncharacterized cupredoxin-like copper-binding protein